METAEQCGRSGWKPAETEMLWQEINMAAENGETLRSVFEKMGQRLGRKPNSVRNYYYMQLRSRGGEELRLAAPFETFSEEEIHALIRSVLTAKGSGQSVRRCVLELSGGDKTRMLRYQNKYRAVLRKRPELVKAVCQELETEGVPYKDPLRESAARHETETKPETEIGINDPDVRQIMQGVKHLLDRAQPPCREDDRLCVQRDLLLMRLEDTQTAAKDVIAACKEFLGMPREAQEADIARFTEALTPCLSRLESVSG